MAGLIAVGWTPHDARAAGSDGSGVDWSADEAVARTLDPYLFWAEASRRAELATVDEGRLSAAFELHRKEDGATLARWLQSEAGMERLEVAPVWLAALAAGRTAFFTGRLRIAGLAAWPQLASFRSIRFGFVGGSFHPARVAHDAVERTPALEQSGCVVGIIDFGCCFAHEHFCRFDGQRWRTRVRALWDQGARPPENSALWTACADFGYGRETDGRRLDDLIAATCAQEGHAPATDGIGSPTVERRCYADADLAAMVPGERPVPHGTQVMDVATGRGFVHPGADGSVGAPPEDDASRAELLFVQLPEPAVRDLSGGWLAVYVIDALRWLIDRAGGRPLVVNLSLGTFAGSHDGESLLERALDAFVDAQVDVVLAAGNIEGIGVHLQADLAAGASAEFDWLLPDGDGTQSFLELWYAAEDRASQPVVTVTPSLGGDTFTLTGPGAALFHRPGEAAERPVGALLHVPGTQAGGRDGLVLVSTAPTMTPGREVPGWPVRAPHGRWRVKVHNPAKAAITLHGWVERDDPGIVPAWLAPQPLLEAVAGCAISDDCTLSGQCGGDKARVVAAYRLNSDQRSLANARGPDRLAGRRRGPDFEAPGSQALHGRDAGLPVAGGFSGASVFSTGTSLAAPCAVRMLVNARGSGPPLPARDGGRLPPVLNTPAAAA